MVIPNSYLLVEVSRQHRADLIAAADRYKLRRLQQVENRARRRRGRA